MRDGFIVLSVCIDWNDRREASCVNKLKYKEQKQWWLYDYALCWNQTQRKHRGGQYTEI